MFKITVSRLDDTEDNDKNSINKQSLASFKISGIYYICQCQQIFCGKKFNITIKVYQHHFSNRIEDVFNKSAFKDFCFFLLFDDKSYLDKVFSKNAFSKILLNIIFTNRDALNGLSKDVFIHYQFDKSLLQEFIDAKKPVEKLALFLSHIQYVELKKALNSFSNSLDFKENKTGVILEQPFAKNFAKKFYLSFFCKKINQNLT